MSESARSRLSAALRAVLQFILVLPRFVAHFWYAHRVCEFAVGLRTKETTRGRCECKAPYPHGVKRNWRGVIPVQRLNALVKELTSTYPNSHAISETGRSRSAR